MSPRSASKIRKRSHQAARKTAVGSKTSVQVTAVENDKNLFAILLFAVIMLFATVDLFLLAVRWKMGI